MLSRAAEHLSAYNASVVVACAHLRACSALNDRVAAAWLCSCITSRPCTLGRVARAAATTAQTGYNKDTTESGICIVSLFRACWCQRSGNLGAVMLQYASTHSSNTMWQFYLIQIARTASTTAAAVSMRTFAPKALGQPANVTPLNTTRCSW